MFNLALLGKQGWRLIKRPDTLAATIFREKYYPYGSFLDSNLGRKPSYAWRSIWNAKPLIKEGLVWRVGDGTSIRIWEDPWLPNPGSHQVRSPVRILAKEAKVCELLDVETNWWNTGLVRDVFGEEVARQICSIAVCPRSRRDQLVWAATRNGEYTVRSAYHLGKENSLTKEGSCSNAQQLAVIWKRIWKIKGARVVKTFLWQACNNILPTKELLFKRHVSPDPLCPICGREIETIGHILWSCLSAKDVWLECEPRIHKCGSEETDFIYIMANLLDRLNEDQLQLVATVARQIWFRRNSVVYGGDLIGPSAVVRRAKEQVAAFNYATQRSSTMVVDPHLNSPAIWVPPPVGHVKINWDAAIYKSQNQMGVGVIVRDHTGKVLAMLCATKGSINHAPTAEAIGVWTAVNLALRMEFHSVVFEGDALELVQALNKEGDCWTSYGQVVNAAKEEIVKHQGWVVQHVRRLANGTAHHLAKSALMYGEGREWREDFPFIVEEPVS